MATKYWCSACGKREAVRILFGYPSFEAWQAEKRGELWLGGCCIPLPEENRETHCLACGHEDAVKYRTKRSLPALRHNQVAESQMPTPISHDAGGYPASRDVALRNSLCGKFDQAT